MKKIVLLFLCVLGCQAIGGIGAFFTYPEIAGWYAGLQKPSFNPPNWIFGPVWTTLYILMGVSLSIVLNQPSSSQRKIALIAFTVQMILNSIWSLLFFKLHSPAAALIEVIFLWCAILFWILKTYPLSKIAALINIPYLLWVSFASVLNFWLWKLNA